MSRIVKKNLHVTLSHELDAELEVQARRLGMPATVIARAAIDAWVVRKRRERVAEEISSYADAVAGTEFDLDEAFEAGGIEDWVQRDA
jgi:predicted transcriptional regulator